MSNFKLSEETPSALEDTIWEPSDVERAIQHKAALNTYLDALIEEKKRPTYGVGHFQKPKRNSKGFRQVRGYLTDPKKQRKYLDHCYRCAIDPEALRVIRQKPPYVTTDRSSDEMGLASQSNLCAFYESSFTSRIEWGKSVGLFDEIMDDEKLFNRSWRTAF